MSKPLIQNLKELINIIYPVGSIYLSVNSTSPASLFGGNWTQLKDRFLIGIGDAYKNGATGGESSHKLINEEIPKTEIYYQIAGTEVGTTFHAQPYAGGGGGDFWQMSLGRTGTYESSMVVNGGNQPHNNMPPYLAVYMWKRTS